MTSPIEGFLDRKPGTYSWIPFGGGGRRCLGAPVAELEMRVLLREVLSRCELQTSRAAPERIARKRDLLAARSNTLQRDAANRFSGWLACAPRRPLRGPATTQLIQEGPAWGVTNRTPKTPAYPSEFSDARRQTAPRADQPPQKEREKRGESMKKRIAASASAIALAALALLDAHAATERAS